jgi:hypothetical protein
MWKKKYFQEKKKTPAIEDRADQLKTDLDLIHSKTIQIIDNECKHFTQMGFLKEAEAGVRRHLMGFIILFFFEEFSVKNEPYSIRN